MKSQTTREKEPGRTGERLLQLPSTPLPLILQQTRALQQRPLEFLMDLTRRYGDTVRTRLLFGTLILVNHPDGVKHVLQENNRNYNKESFDYRALRKFLRHGLLTDDGPAWLQQRRLMQPAFHRQRLATFGAMITASAGTMFERWQGIAGSEQPIDIAQEMMNLTLRIVGHALFSSDLSAASDVVGQSFSETNQLITDYANTPFPPLFVPTPRNRRLRRAGLTLEGVVTALIAQRRSEQDDPGDLLSMLLDARDEESGEGMDDALIRDNVVTLLIAGHETTSNALAWTWYLLSQHPETEQRLSAELAAVLGGRAPTVADLPRLTYTRMVLEEAMRLYPPAWAFTRQAIHDDEINGYHVPAGSEVLLCPYTTHRHPDFWERPEVFDPERFGTEQAAERPHYAYFPFGGGPRLCIGRDFALLEARLILATVFQRYRLRLAPGVQIAFAPLITLRPRYGLPMIPQRLA